MDNHETRRLTEDTKETKDTKGRAHGHKGEGPRTQGRGTTDTRARDDGHKG